MQSAQFIFPELKQQQWILLRVNTYYACAKPGKRDKSRLYLLIVTFLLDLHKFNLLSISKVATCAHSVAQTLSTLSHA
jgi:hypothetical protein